MSRYSPDVDREDLREQPAAGQQTSGRGGGGGASSSAELIAIIDQAAADKPTMAQLLDRLQARGVQPVPSVNARGLNGMSYAFRGSTVRGSDLGRAYTAHGLQQRKGIDYSPDRDALAVQNAVERAHGFARTDPVGRVVETPTRGSRARDRETGLSVEQRAMLTEIGRFRAIETRDLVQHRYGGRRDNFEADFRILKAAGLVERAGIEHPKSGRVYSVIALTKAGKNTARRLAGSGSGQRFYSGFVKPAEVRHDVGIYRMYQRERTVIEASGGTIRRVVTDFEIKRRLMSELNRRGEDPRDAGRKKAIAARHQISVVNDRFVIPDLRVEYETREGELSKVDLELATQDYKPAQIAAKKSAGIKIYGPDSTSGGTPREPEDRGVYMSF
jgi:hypothetical protein